MTGVIIGTIVGTTTNATKTNVDNMSTLNSRDLNDRLIELTRAVDRITAVQSDIDELITSDLARAEPNFEDKLEAARDKLADALFDFGGAEVEFAELIVLSSTVNEWDAGVQLVPVDEFPDYCRELCEEIGDVPRDFPSYIVIDWDATAENLKPDYSECEYMGETYLYRSC